MNLKNHRSPNSVGNARSPRPARSSPCVDGHPARSICACPPPSSCCPVSVVGPCRDVYTSAGVTPGWRCRSSGRSGCSPWCSPACGRTSPPLGGFGQPGDLHPAARLGSDRSPRRGGWRSWRCLPCWSCLGWTRQRSCAPRRAALPPHRLRRHRGLFLGRASPAALRLCVLLFTCSADSAACLLPLPTQTSTHTLRPPPPRRRRSTARDVWPYIASPAPPRLSVRFASSNYLQQQERVW